MGKQHSWRMDASLAVTSSASFASNQQYAAYVRQDSIRITSLESSDTFEKRHASFVAQSNKSRPILAFSSLRTNVFSVSTGPRTTVWDVNEDAPFLTLHDSERAVTSSAWSNHNLDILALGHIDGQISIWNLKHPARPEKILYTGNSQCHLLSWSTSDNPVLAACSGQVLHLWEDCLSVEPVCHRQSLDYPPQDLLWRPGSAKAVLIVSPDGSVEEWEANGSTVEQHALDDLEEGLFGDLEDLQPGNLTLSQRFALQPAAHLLWVGTSGLVTLDRYGRFLQLYRDLRSAECNDTIWSAELSAKADFVTMLREEDAVKVLAIGPGSMESRIIEQDVLGQLGDMSVGIGQKAEMPPANQVTGSSNSTTQHVTSAQSNASECIKSSSERTQTRKWQSDTMRPVPLSMSKTTQKKHTKHHFRRSADVQIPSRLRPFTSASDKSVSTAQPTQSPRQAMASRLEPPRQDEQESPMPFLSPTIPSRQASTTAIPTLGDDIFLPPPENDSFGSLPSTAMNDSDSDDEAFDGDALKGSGTLMMPGGSNVPLPKSCGAFFSPNGQLVTFFPPKPKTHTKDVDGLSSSQPEERSTKASRLFPVFGNLAVEGNDYEDSDIESVDSQDSLSASDSPDPKLFSFPTKVNDSWPDRLGPMQGSIHPGSDQQTVVVSVRNVNDIIRFRPDIARSYQTSCSTDMDAAKASEANAEVARSAGLENTANIWSLLGLILRHKIEPVATLPELHGIDGIPKRPGRSHAQPSKESSTRDFSSAEDLKSTNTDIISLARQANKHMRNNSVTTSTYSNRAMSWLSSLIHTGPKFGSSWIISEIFSWTESRADVQMLACLSAVLLSTAQPFGSQQKAQTPIFDSRSSLLVSDYFDDSLSHKPSDPRMTPVLHADSRDGSFLTQSPAKQPYSSHVSSRNPSQPTTPYIDSLSSTPPFPFPRLSRSGSRLSASGSASPEHHRSSFGAAAKYYAQSITDKISSYGTSPPAKRFGTSPNNELSSSLPGGSWSKSVSFASGVEHVHDSRSSARLAPEDAYDSDRTIEDVSLPQTPKKPTGRISLTLKNVGAFVPPRKSQNQPQPQPLLSPLLAAKAKIWISHYAERLRLWDLHIKAAELDNIAGLSVRSPTRQPKHTGIQPDRGPKPLASCGVCACKIRGVQHVCPRCLHTTHLACLEGFVRACGGEGMECPTGCGCVCSDLPCEEVVWDDEAGGDEVEDAPPPTVRKKRSLTDPRVWRAMVQGDSW